MPIAWVASHLRPSQRSAVLDALIGPLICLWVINSYRCCHRGDVLSCIALAHQDLIRSSSMNLCSLRQQSLTLSVTSVLKHFLYMHHTCRHLLDTTLCIDVKSNIGCWGDACAFEGDHLNGKHQKLCSISTVICTGLQLCVMVASPAYFLMR